MSHRANRPTAGATVRRDPFGVTPTGEHVAVFTLANRRGMVVRLMEYGGIVLSIAVPDRDGHVEDVTLGYATLEEYLNDARFAGALIGRYANRIAQGRFRLEGRTYTLERNNGPHHLHGGRHGFHAVVWRGRVSRAAASAAVVLRHRSPDGQGGYPGTLDTTVRCSLDDDNALTFDFRAVTDRPTPVSFTQHSYFNLAGSRTGEVRSHELTIHASRFTPVDEELIPTGELRPVVRTPFDFTSPAVIGERLEQPDPQLAIAGGFDHNFVIDRPAGRALAPAARLRDPISGRVLAIATTLPGLQFYSGATVPDAGSAGGARRGVALEAQEFPDAPNKPGFPGSILRPGEICAARIVYQFSADAPA